MYVRGYLQGSENGRVVTIEQEQWKGNTIWVNFVISGTL